MTEKECSLVCDIVNGIYGEISKDGKPATPKRLDAEIKRSREKYTSELGISGAEYDAIVKDYRCCMLDKEYRQRR